VHRVAFRRITRATGSGDLFDWGGTANYSMEILRPKSTGLDSNDRIYAAYPGLTYNIRAAVIGGVYPYKYELTANVPSGMTIDINTGEITWLNPSADTYTDITMRVTDSVGTQVTSTWTVVCATTRFKFVDAVGGSNSNSGTLASQWQTIAHARSNSNATHIIYLAAGSYDSVGISDTGDGMRFSQSHGNPCIWLAREGETVNWTITNGTRTVHDVRGDIQYWDGIRFTGWGGTGENSIGFYKQIGDYSVWRRCVFHDYGPGVDGFNSAPIMWQSGGYASGHHDNNVVQDCEFYNQDYGSANCATKLYATNKLLVEDNVVHDFDAGSESAFANKAGNTQSTFRGNHTYDILTPGYGGNQSVEATGECDAEVCFNHFEGPADPSLGGVTTVHANLNGEQSVSCFYYRNTVEGGFTIRFLGTGDGPTVLDSNVLINETTDDTPDGSHIDRDGATGDTSTLTLTNHLAGNAAAGYIDANGLLTGASRTSYLYLRGHEVPTL
jgi:hypothetical protein